MVLMTLPIPYSETNKDLAYKDREIVRQLTDGSTFIYVAGVQFSNGTAALPSITFQSDLDTGLYRASENTLGFTGAGTSLGTWTTGNLSINAGDISWSAGVAVTGSRYSISRDTDATNQLHFNVPTGASMEWSINDAAEMSLSSTTLDLQNNAITTTSSITGNTIVSTVAIGTSPLTITSTTKVSNLNVDFLEGIDWTSLNLQLTWTAGTAVTGGSYQIGRDFDATNQLHFNVPTGASFEFSVNDVPEITISATAINFQNNSITTTGGGSLTGTWTDLGSVTTIDINGGTVDSLTSLSVRSTGASFDMKIAATAVYTVNRTLTFATADLDRTITLSGDPTLADWFNQAVKTTSNPTFGNITITSFAANWTNSGRTVSDLGIITTVDINGGTLDGVSIGGSSASSGSFTTIAASTNLTITTSTSSGVMKTISTFSSGGAPDLFSDVTIDGTISEFYTIRSKCAVNATYTLTSRIFALLSNKTGAGTQSTAYVFDFPVSSDFVVGSAVGGTQDQKFRVRVGSTDYYVPCYTT